MLVAALQSGGLGQGQGLHRAREAVRVGVWIGVVDMSLLASTLITPGARLWMLGKRLAPLAERFGVAHR